MPMCSTLPTTLLFFPLTLTVYFLLSTLHIYCPSSGPPTSGAPLTHDPTLPPANSTSRSEFLFRIGNLHIYGIRLLFMIVVVGGSLLTLTGVVYWGLALRKAGTTVVAAMEREGRSPRTMTGDPRNNGNRSAGVRRQGDGGGGSVQQGRRAAVSYLRGGRAQAREREMDIQLRRLEGGEEEEDTTRRRGTRIGATASAQRASDMASEYEIPSCYLDESTERLEPDRRADWRRGSAGVPSYYFKEHDAEGRSILLDPYPGAEKGGSSFEMSELDLNAPAAATRVHDDDDDTEQAQQSFGEIASRSLTGSTAVSVDGRGGRGVSSDLAAGAFGERAGQTTLEGDEDWEIVYCSGWRGAEG